MVTKIKLELMPDTIQAILGVLEAEVAAGCGDAAEARKDLCQALEGKTV